MVRPLAIIALVLVASLLALWAGMTLASQQVSMEAGRAGATFGPPESYRVEMNVSSDPCGHDFYIFRSGTSALTHNLKLTYNPSEGTLSGPEPWVQIAVHLNSNPGHTEEFTGEGTGTVAGIQNVSVTFNGAFSLVLHTVSGTYTFGANNELPSGNCPDHTAHPAVYNVKPKEGPTGSPTSTPQTPVGPTPTQPFPHVDGSCAFITSLAFFQGEQWDQYKCDPSVAGTPYTRVDIYVGSSSPTAAVFSNVRFVCQGSHEIRIGVHKGIRSGAFTPYAYIDVWSAEFDQKCVPGAAGGGASLFAQPDTGGHPAAIYNAIFTDMQSPTATPTVTPTATLPGHTATPTATPPVPPATPTVTPTATLPAANGSCIFVTHEGPLHGRTWDQWKCTPGPQVAPFNRVDIVLDDILGIEPQFVCQENGLKAIGALKGTRPEVWSAVFPQKCSTNGPTEGGVSVYLPQDQPQDHITGVAFTNVGPPQPTVTPTSERGGNGDCNGDGHTNSIDAAVALQFGAGLLHTISAACNVNGDGRTDALDAALILQYDAALIHQLPV